MVAQKRVEGRGEGPDGREMSIGEAAGARRHETNYSAS